MVERRSVKEIFGEAVELRPEQRAEFLDEACGDDFGLRTQVRELLRVHDAAGRFLAAPTQQGRTPTGGDTGALFGAVKGAAGDSAHMRGGRVQQTERPGMLIGRYKLLELIGEGGFGVVFLAEQQEPVVRRVALKVIKPGMDTRQVISRFDAERQALALMDHPNIAKVLEAGATESGRPYFVMELVTGNPITAYCDAANLGTSERLDLFVQVCHAVQHAHTKGIIHRDLKPSNILVTIIDGAPTPKVIDFGVAKATDSSLTATTRFTEFHQLIGTPEYMSPEQATLSGVDIDTRSDIYSLGVLLYELLTGTPPFDIGRLRSAAWDEMLRIIREEEPQKPSTRLLSMKETIAVVAALRGIEPARLTKLIRGDLDWIVMKCLEKDRARRYMTASGLAADLGRHQRYEPVAAGPPSRAYRVRKFVRRHRGPLAASGAVLVVLLAGIVVSSIGFITAAGNAARFQKMSDIADMRASKASEAEGEALQAKVTAEKERDAATFEAYVANLSAAAASLNANELGGARNRLDACAPPLRNWEWRHLDARTDQSLLVLRGHQSALTSASMNPAGDRIATASADTTVRIWDAFTGKELTVLRGHTAQLKSVAYNATGDRLVTASSDKTARVWDAVTGAELLTLAGHQFVVGSAVFNTSGDRIITGSADRTARVWDVVTGAELAVLRGHESLVSCASFSPGGNLCLTASVDGTARLWDTSTGKQLRVLQGHTGAISTAVFNSTGKLVATSSADQTARVWDAATGTELVILRGHARRLYSATFSPAGDRIVTASFDGTARIWETATGAQILVLSGHGDPVTHGCFSPEGDRVITASHDRTARVWNASTGKELAVLRAHRYHVNSAFFDQSGSRVVTTSLDHTARVWDANPNGSPVIVCEGKGPILSASFNTAGNRVMAIDVTARLWDATTGRELAALNKPPTELTAAALSAAEDRLVTGDADGLVGVSDWPTGKEQMMLRGHTASVRSAVFNRAGDSILTASDDSSARIWDTRTGTTVAILPHKGAVRSAVFSTSGEVVLTVSADKMARLWNAADGTCLAVLSGHTDDVVSGQFSPLGDRVVTASSDLTARIWDTSTGASLAVLRGHREGVLGATFDITGTRALTASLDSTARVWDARTGSEIAVLRGHEDTVRSAVFSPAGDRIVTSSVDRTARVWDPQTGRELLVLRGHQSLVRAAVFSPSGDRLLTTSFDGTTRIWDSVPYRERFRERAREEPK